MSSRGIPRPRQGLCEGAACPRSGPDAACRARDDARLAGLPSKGDFGPDRVRGLKGQIPLDGEARIRGPFARRYDAAAPVRNATR